MIGIETVSIIIVYETQQNVLRGEYMISKNELSRLKKIEASIKPDDVIKIYIEGLDGIIRDGNGKAWTKAELETERESARLSNSNLQQILFAPASRQDKKTAPEK